MTEQQAKLIKGIKVAVVDDDVEILFVVSSALRHYGFTIDCTAQSGEAIVHAIQEGKRPDVIVMDFRMRRKLNGLQTAKAIKEMLPNVNIILATADDAVRDNPESTGFTYLFKPFSISALARLIIEQTL